MAGNPNGRAVETGVVKRGGQKWDTLYGEELNEQGDCNRIDSVGAGSLGTVHRIHSCGLLLFPVSFFLIRLQHAQIQNILFSGQGW